VVYRDVSWLIRAITGCEADELRLALRLYWREHRVRLLRLWGGLVGCAAVLIASSFLISWPRLPSAHDGGSAWPYVHRMYPFHLLPILVVPVLLSSPKRISYPTGLTPRSILVAVRSGILPSVFIVLVAYQLMKATLPAMGESAGYDSEFGGWLWHAFEPLRTLGAIPPLAYLIACACVPALVLTCWIRSDGATARSMLLAASVWLSCHLLLNTVRWDVWPQHVSNPRVTERIEHYHFAVAALCAISLTYLYRYSSLRLPLFLTSCIVFTAVHLAAVPLCLQGVVPEATLLITSIATSLSMGQPPGCWEFFVGSCR